MIKLFSLKQQKKDGESTPKVGNQKKASAAQLRITKDLNELNLPKTCSTEFPDPDDLLSFKLVICPDEGFYRGGKFTFSFKVGPNYPHEPPKVKCETQVYHPNIDLEGNVCLNILREDWKPVLTVSSIVYGLQYLFLTGGKDLCVCGRYENWTTIDQAISTRVEIWKMVSGVPPKPTGSSEAMSVKHRTVGRHRAFISLVQEFSSVLLYLFVDKMGKRWWPNEEPNPEDPLNKEAAEVLQNNRRVFEQNVQKAMRGGNVGNVYFERCLK